MDAERKVLTLQNEKTRQDKRLEEAIEETIGHRNESSRMQDELKRLANEILSSINEAIWPGWGHHSRSGASSRLS